MTTQSGEPGTHENEVHQGAVERLGSSRPASRTILLISVDKQFHENLRALANTTGQMVVRTEGGAGTVAIVQVTRPVAVLFDLDLRNEAAWERADLLLREPSCPPVILLTERTAQFDVRTAIRAGSVVSKSESPSRLLEIVEEAWEMSEASQAERNAIQRVLMRWLRPSEWVEPTTPAYRFWGINE